MKSRILLALLLTFGLIGTAGSTVYLNGQQILSTAEIITESLILEDPDAGINRITIQAPTALSSDYSLALPTDDGTLDQVLTTDGSGNLTWEDVAGAMVMFTFQDVYDDDVSAASFDLDAAGSFSVADSLSNDIFQVRETDDSVHLASGGTDYLTLSDNGGAEIRTNGTALLLNDGGGGATVSIGAGAGVNTLQGFSTGTLQIQANSSSDAGKILFAEPNQIFLFSTDTEGDVQISAGNGSGGAGSHVSLFGNTNAAGTNKAEIRFEGVETSDADLMLTATVDDSGGAVKLMTVRPATGSTFADADSSYFNFHNGSSVVAKILLSGAWTGPAGNLHVESEKDSADQNGMTVLSEHVFADFDSAATVTSVEFLPDAALTANDTNFATLTVYRRDTSGGTQTTIVAATTETTGTGSWTAFDSVDLGTLSVTALAANEVITWEITKTGAGVVVPSGTLKVSYTND